MQGAIHEMAKIPMAIRIDPDVMAAAEELARRQNRSLANLVETILRQQCEAVGVPIGEQPAARSRRRHRPSDGS